MITKLIAVALGGALGALLRFFTALMLPHAPNQFPTSTLLVNSLGSFLIGIVFIGLSEKAWLPDYAKELVLIGFLGALTTFSTFSLDAIKLIEAGQPITAIIYIVLSVILCIFAAFLGMQLTRML